MFANPVFLFGLLAVSVPILIHLIFRRKRRAIEYPTLIFFKRVDMKLASRRKIKERLLLFLRMIVVTLIAGLVLLYYEYILLKPASIGTPHDGPQRRVSVSPVSKREIEHWLAKTEYIKTFIVELDGGGEGFPSGSSLHIETSTGALRRIA